MFAQDGMIYYLHKNRNFIEKIERQLEEDKDFERRADFMHKLMASKQVNPNWPDDISSGLWDPDKTHMDYTVARLVEEQAKTESMTATPKKGVVIAPQSPT